jgi:hypothetical protein
VGVCLNWLLWGILTVQICKIPGFPCVASPTNSNSQTTIQCSLKIPSDFDPWVCSTNYLPFTNADHGCFYFFKCTAFTSLTPPRRWLPCILDFGSFVRTMEMSMQLFFRDGLSALCRFLVVSVRGWLSHSECHWPVLPSLLPSSSIFCLQDLDSQEELQVKNRQYGTQRYHRFHCGCELSTLFSISYHLNFVQCAATQAICSIVTGGQLIALNNIQRFSELNTVISVRNGPLCFCIPNELIAC